LAIALWVVIVDYMAQIPYYVVNYYIPHHAAPSASSVALLSLTLLWFLIGYFGLRKRKRFGYWLLQSFLLVEGLFYLRTLLFGAAALQLENPDPVIRAVFLIGYATGIVSLFYFAMLIVFRRRYPAPRDGSQTGHEEKGR
jgi:NADH:ubiquinone oxidoreductase subunit K